MKGVGLRLSCKPFESPMAVADIFYGQLPFPESLSPRADLAVKNQCHNLRDCKLNMEPSLVIVLREIDIVKLE